MDVSDVGAAPQMPPAEDPPEAPAADVGGDEGISGGDVSPAGGGETGETGATGATDAGSSPVSSGPTEVQRQLQTDSFTPSTTQSGPGASRTEPEPRADARREDAQRRDVETSQQQRRDAMQRDTFQAAGQPRTPTSVPPRTPTSVPERTPTTVPPRTPTTPTGMSPGKPELFLADRLKNMDETKRLAGKQFPNSSQNTYNVGDNYTKDPRMTGDSWDPKAGMSGGNRIWADTAARRTNEGMARIGTSDPKPEPSITEREMGRFRDAGAPVTKLDPKATPDTSWPDRTPAQTKPELDPNASPRPTPPAAAPREPTQTKPELNPNAGPRPTPPAAAPREPTQTRPELNPNAGPRPTPPAAAPREPTVTKPELTKSEQPTASQKDSPAEEQAKEDRLQPPPARAATVRPQTPGGPKQPGPAGGAPKPEVRTPTPRTGAFHSGFRGADVGYSSATTQKPEAYGGRGAATRTETTVRNGESASTTVESHNTRRNGQRDSAPTVSRSGAPEGHIRTSASVRTPLLNPAEARATLAGAPRTDVPLLNDPTTGVKAEAHYQGPAINVTGNAYLNWTGSNMQPGMDLHVDAKVEANVVSGGGSVSRDFKFNDGNHDYTVRVKLATDGQVGMNGTVKLDVHAGLDKPPSFTVGAEGFAGVQGKLGGSVQVFMDGHELNPLMQGDLSINLGAGVGGAFELSASPNSFHTKAYAYAGVGVGVDLNAQMNWVEMSNVALPRGKVMPWDPNAHWVGPLHQLQFWQSN